MCESMCEWGVFLGVWGVVLGVCGAFLRVCDFFLFVCVESLCVKFVCESFRVCQCQFFCMCV